MRSARSAVDTSIVVGTSTAPSLIPASMISHSSTRLGSISSTRSPRATPHSRRYWATWCERADISANVIFCSLPSSPTTHSAGVRLSLASTSKKSSAQLKWSSWGGEKSR